MAKRQDEWEARVQELEVENFLITRKLHETEERMKGYLSDHEAAIRELSDHIYTLEQERAKLQKIMGAFATIKQLLT